MCRELINFPDLMSFNDYGGSYDDYENALLEVYNTDLWDSNLQFAGLNVKPRVHKRFELNGKSLDWTFAHFTSKGLIDDDRELDLRRCERLGYVKLIIENAHLECIKVYENTRLDNKGKPKKSIVLWCECVNAKIVLTKIRKQTGDYYVITTFYLVNNQNNIKGNNDEYEQYVAKNGEFPL